MVKVRDKASSINYFCIRSINQSNRSISIRLLFLFCSRVFISRSYENRSISEASVLSSPEGLISAETGSETFKDNVPLFL